MGRDMLLSFSAYMDVFPMRTGSTSNHKTIRNHKDNTEYNGKESRINALCYIQFCFLVFFGSDY